MYNEDWECFYCQMSNNWQKDFCYWCKKPRKEEPENQIPLYAPSPFDDNLYAPAPFDNKEYEMKTVHEAHGFRFFFTPDDLIGNEPPHVHIKRGHGSRDRAKIWLRDLTWHHCYGFNFSEQRNIMKEVEKNQEFLLEEWKYLRGGKE